MQYDFEKLINDIFPQVVNWRRHLHQYPELSFKEHNTSQFIFDTLSSFGGLEVSHPTPTSVMARLIGSTPGKVLAIRADMDALPLTEQNECAYKSKNAGVMHACGHDGHSATLLGTAKILSGMQDKIKGEVRFLFQHAEETPPGGAVQMIDAGVMNGVDMVIGIHVWSTMPLGKVGVIAGPMMAAPDNFEITILGKGGHGGFPHQAIDSIAIAAQVITNLQHIVARNIDPIDNAVISVTQIAGGTTHNILAESTVLKGTVRSFKPEVRERLRQLMEQVVKGITSAHGANYSFNYILGYHPVINNPTVANLLEEVIRKNLGDSWVDKMPPNMGGEDFSAFLEKAPGCYLFVGAGDINKKINYPHHHPKFDINEEALAASMKIFLGAAAKVVF